MMERLRLRMAPLALAGTLLLACPGCAKFKPASTGKLRLPPFPLKLEKGASPAFAILSANLQKTALLTYNQPASAARIALGSARSSLSVTPETGFGALWTNNALLPDLENGGASYSGPGTASPQDWMGDQMNPLFEDSEGRAVTVFGRFESLRQRVCYLDFLITTRDSENYPVDGTYNLTAELTSGSLIMQACNPEATVFPGTMNIDVTVSTPADTTVYDKKLTVVFKDTDPTGVKPSIYYVRNKDGVIAAQGLEDQGAFSAALTGTITRIFGAYDQSTKVTRFEFSEHAFGPTGDGSILNILRFYRIHSDETTGVAQVLGANDDLKNGLTNQFVLNGKLEDAATPSALSMKIATSPASLYRACILPSDGSIVTDDSLSCGVEGRSVADATAFASVETGRTGPASYVSGFTEISTVPFTDASEQLSEATP